MTHDDPWPGALKRGGDDTLFALSDGVVRFEKEGRRVRIDAAEVV